jgi:hypothetical protein
MNKCAREKTGKHNVSYTGADSQCPGRRTDYLCLECPRSQCILDDSKHREDAKDSDIYFENKIDDGGRLESTLHHMK